MILAGPLFFLSLLEVKNGDLGEDVLTAGKRGADGKASPGCVTQGVTSGLCPSQSCDEVPAHSNVPLSRN